MKLTYRYRVKDKHIARLNAHARAVNYVWNFCNDTQISALTRGKKWPSNYDLQKLTSGCSKELNLSADTIGKVCERYAQSRKWSKRNRLKWRTRKCLGWVPLKGASIKLQGERIFYFGTLYDLWLSRRIPEGSKLHDGSCFSQDSRGCWYLNLVVEVPERASCGKAEVGIDLGLKDFVTMSDANRVEAPRFYRKAENDLRIAQRAKKKRRVAKISAKISNQRKDFHHKLSTNIVKNHALIVVGNVNSSSLRNTRMAKSVSDAGWSSFREMIAYKSIGNGAIYVEVNENFTTQMCSSCGVIGGPKGREQLCVREWQCDCGSVNDRDVNAALNILRLGHETLTGAAKVAEMSNRRARKITAFQHGGERG